MNTRFRDMRMKRYYLAYRSLSGKISLTAYSKIIFERRVYFPEAYLTRGKLGRHSPILHTSSSSKKNFHKLYDEIHKERNRTNVEKPLSPFLRYLLVPTINHFLFSLQETKPSTIQTQHLNPRTE